MARRRPHRAGHARPAGAAGGERGHPAAVLRRRAHPQPARRRRDLDRPHPRTTRADLARAAFEAMLCALADAVDALLAATGEEPRRVLLVGGATRSPAVRALAPAVLGRPVLLPPTGEYVARGAARQAAWALAGSAEPPAWPLGDTETLTAEPAPGVRARYAELRDRFA
nr:FGGY-family carbohydrate kinase [Nocardioides sp. TF02-7]